MVSIKPWHDLEMPREDTDRLLFERDLLPTFIALPGVAVQVVVLKRVDADAGEPDVLVSAGGCDECSPNSRVQLVVFLRNFELYEH